jgi:hypothetical protein
MRKRAAFSLVLVFIVGCAAGEAPERPDQRQVVKMRSEIMPAYVSYKDNIFDTIYTRIEVTSFVSVYNATVQPDEDWQPRISQLPRFVLDSTKGAVYDVTKLVKYEKQLTMQEVIQ